MLELTRLYATDEAIRDGLNFCDLDDFSLVVCKPDRNVIYTGCRWKSLQESAEVGVMTISPMAGHFSRIIAAT